MPLSLNQLLPSLGQSLEGIGFLFGAGASYEAGYPLMSTLTRQVVAKLNTAQRAALDSVLAATGQTYDDTSATPNIEEVSDLTIAHALNSGDPAFASLEQQFRALIVEVLLSVSNPAVTHHVAFFEALKKRTFGMPCSVWIFTTNYDVVVETAAALAGVRLENGFAGSTTRFFDIGQLGQVHGSSDGQRFTPYPGLIVKLIKLHGSLSWAPKGGLLVEQHPDSLGPTTTRTMVLPRRRKVMDTLSPPYDQLFAHASRVIGSECKYLISCGYSFSDEHINQAVLLPALRSGRCRLTALCDVEPGGLADFKPMPTVSAAFSTHAWSNLTATPDTTNLWRFSTFAAAF